MCIHECISAFCYYEVYKDLDKKMPKFENDAKESEVRETRKSQFKACLEKNNIASQSELKSDKKSPKSYSELRSECSAKQCKNIEKDDRFSRDLCLHKCVNVECFEMAYGDIEVSELSYQDL